MTNSAIGTMIVWIALLRLVIFANLKILIHRDGAAPMGLLDNPF
jgi:hypothetical protein